MKTECKNCGISFRVDRAYQDSNIICPVCDAEFAPQGERATDDVCAVTGSPQRRRSIKVILISCAVLFACVWGVSLYCGYRYSEVRSLLMHGRSMARDGLYGEDLQEHIMLQVVDSLHEDVMEKLMGDKWYSFVFGRVPSESQYDSEMRPRIASALGEMKHEDSVTRVGLKGCWKHVEPDKGVAHVIDLEDDGIYHGGYVYLGEEAWDWGVIQREPMQKWLLHKGSIVRTAPHELDECKVVRLSQTHMVLQEQNGHMLLWSRVVPNHQQKFTKAFTTQ